MLLQLIARGYKWNSMEKIIIYFLIYSLPKKLVGVFTISFSHVITKLQKSLSIQMIICRLKDCWLISSIVNEIIIKWLNI